ncbi:hypothetical protein [Halobacillus sp. A5]|uniref:hypothetical protein n=1 Tax=Halobacillus sp. A5 TaxID=2880263 RepID=UPI0020A6C2B3|nr:hypothetical protein [Halobacillus sp. A5]MCP3026014.1 hypothetical protein [Halobacillus sp. A5]
MPDVLEPIDLRLLQAIYDKDYSRKEINWDEFESINHRASHLERLERNGFIEFKGEALTPGGQKDPKYGTAIAMIWPENIHITDIGVEKLK